MDLRVLRVVVASPGDVNPERDIVSKVVEEVNRTIGRERRLTLEVHRWETDSHPGFHPQGPQGLIDPILKIEDCDLLIGIFWRRFGTPVSDAKSGTEHEFRIAYQAWERNHRPQIMVYFSQKPYAPKSKEETDQWGLVLQFKKDFPKEGLWWEYKNKSEFERVIRNHLTQFLQAQSPIEIKSEKKQPETTPLTPLFQLPPPPADFTGRTAELRELRAAIEKGGVHISGLHGQGGVGKTALALKLAAELAPNYPDAQIYLDLKGVSEKPITPAEAMSHVLRTLHPEARLPEKEEDLRPLYNSVLHGKRALLLMDNAKDAAQVQPLTPPRGCTLLVTSRNHFYLHGLHARDLDTLPPSDAKDFLLSIAPRMNNEAEAIAKLCGYLPQALLLAAKTIVERRDLSPANYCEKLADEKHRLELLGGGKEGVEASISLSYKLLNPKTQKRWRILGVFPDTFDIRAAAAVWKLETDPAQDSLSHLLKFSMLEWNQTTSRYRLHDLMRASAHNKLSAGDSEIVALRHASHYQTLLSHANDFYKKGGDSIMTGLTLFDLEWGNIQAGQALAADHAAKDGNAATLCNKYADGGTYILSLRQHPRQQIQWREAALVAARQLKDRAAEGVHLGSLGLAYDSLGEFRRAIEYHEQHLVIARQIDDRKGEGQVLGNLGSAYHALGEYRRAIEYHELDLAIARQIGDRKGESGALGNLGIAYRNLGEYRRAIEYYEQALAIARQIGDRRGEGQVLGNLGNAYHSLGEYSRAIGHHEQCLAIARQIGDRKGEGQALGNLGVAYYSLGEYRRAIEHYEQRLAIAREIGDRQGEGTALWNMSLALDKLDNRRQALEHAEAALKIHEQIEDPNTEKVRKRLALWRNS
ncbi:MAG: tetratricopeptide repeat protein [Candidatus Sulfotelmatobacter sp.]